MVYKPTYNWGGHPVPSGGRMNSAMCFQQERLVGLNFAYVLMKKHHIVWQSCGFDSFMTESLVNMSMFVATEQSACVQCSLSNTYQHKSGH